MPGPDNISQHARSTTRPRCCHGAVWDSAFNVSHAKGSPRGTAREARKSCNLICRNAFAKTSAPHADASCLLPSLGRSDQSVCLWGDCPVGTTRGRCRARELQDALNVPPTQDGKRPHAALSYRLRLRKRGKETAMASMMAAIAVAVVSSPKPAGQLPRPLCTHPCERALGRLARTHRRLHGTQPTIS